MARKITGVNDIPTNFNENKQAETHTITEWCLKLKISLIDTKYFEDNNKYTIQEFESIIPRDIQVPLPEDNWKEKSIMLSRDEKTLNSIVQEFYQDKQSLDYYKKQTDMNNTHIKELMKKLNKTEFETVDGLIAKITIQNRESFDEDKLLTKIKELILNKKCTHKVIKTIEVVDMDELENAIYNGEIDASELTNCKILKEVVILKVTERKDK